ncbi:hypothetical protein [Polaromonas sp.]|uniref:hypothetical protein n=1 Tax=Polaromonas sp. TaxID=1869339 RepID=UPI003BAD2E76
MSRVEKRGVTMTTWQSRSASNHHSAKKKPVWSCAAENGCLEEVVTQVTPLEMVNRTAVGHMD